MRILSIGTKDPAAYRELVCKVLFVGKGSITPATAMDVALGLHVTNVPFESDALITLWNETWICYSFTSVCEVAFRAVKR